DGNTPEGEPAAGWWWRSRYSKGQGLLHHQGLGLVGALDPSDPTLLRATRPSRTAHIATVMSSAIRFRTNPAFRTFPRGPRAMIVPARRNGAVISGNGLHKHSPPRQIARLRHPTVKPGRLFHCERGAARVAYTARRGAIRSSQKEDWHMADEERKPV